MLFLSESMRSIIFSGESGSKKYVTSITSDNVFEVAGNDGTECSCIKRLAIVSDLIRPIAQC